jgi:hypothetical protein
MKTMQNNNSTLNNTMHFEESKSSFKILPIKNRRPLSGHGFKTSKILSIDNKDNFIPIPEKIKKIEEISTYL